MYERILVALDGSEMAEAVLAYVERIAASFSSEVTLAHVCPPEEGPFTHMHEIYMDFLREGLSQKLNSKKATVKSALLTGIPQVEILDYAEKNNSDLIAITTHGRGGIGRWVLGSISDKIIRAARTPMIVIHSRKGEKEPKPTDKAILVPLDGSEAGEAALPHAEALAKAMNREIILFQVLEAVVVAGDLSGEVAAHSKYLVQAEWKATENYLSDIVKRLQGNKIAARHQIILGTPATEIARTAIEQEVDLIAISTHGRSGIARWALGSVTERLMTTVDIPMLIVRAQTTPA